MSECVLKNSLQVPKNAWKYLVRSEKFCNSGLYTVIFTIYVQLFIRLRDSGSFLHRQYCCVQTESEKTLWIKDVLQAYSVNKYLLICCYLNSAEGRAVMDRLATILIRAYLVTIVCEKGKGKPPRSCHPGTVKANWACHHHHHHQQRNVVLHRI